MNQIQEGPMSQEDRTNQPTPGNCPLCGADISAIERREFEEHVESRFAWENGHWQIKTREEKYTSTEFWCGLCDHEIGGDLSGDYLYNLPVVTEFAD
jgi:hypothetical protein